MKLTALKLEILTTLKENFPASVFQIKEEFTATRDLSAVNVLLIIKWVDGPTWDDVKAIAAPIALKIPNVFIYPQRTYSYNAYAAVIEALRGTNRDIDDEIRHRRF